MNAESLKKLINDMKEELKNAIEESRKDLKNDIGNINRRLSEIERENQEIREEAEELRRENEYLRVRIQQSEDYSRRNNILISGIKNEENETVEDLTEKVKENGDITWCYYRRIRYTRMSQTAGKKQ